MSKNFMLSKSTPLISVQLSKSLKADSYQSHAMSLLRGVAALQVTAAHLRAEVFPGLQGMMDAPYGYQILAFATGFAHQAVVVFFFISGWLVGGSLLDKWSHPNILASYAIDRVSRLWTVLIPILLLSLCCSALTEKLIFEPSISTKPTNFQPCHLWVI